MAQEGCRFAQSTVLLPMHILHCKYMKRTHIHMQRPVTWFQQPSLFACQFCRHRRGMLVCTSGCLLPLVVMVSEKNRKRRKSTVSRMHARSEYSELERTPANQHCCTLFHRCTQHHRRREIECSMKLLRHTVPKHTYGPKTSRDSALCSTSEVPCHHPSCLLKLHTQQAIYHPHKTSGKL